MDKSELRRTGNRIEVSRHSTAKLNKMKMDKYKDPIKREVVDDNIKMEVPDGIATDTAKIYFKKKVTLLMFVMCLPRRSGSGRLLSST